MVGAIFSKVVRVGGCGESNKVVSSAGPIMIVVNVRRIRGAVCWASDSENIVIGL